MNYITVGQANISSEIPTSPKRHEKKIEKSVSIGRIVALQSQLPASVEEEPRHRNQNETKEGKDASSPVDPNP